MAEWSGSFDLDGPGVGEGGFDPVIDLDGDGTADTAVLHGGLSDAYASAFDHGSTEMTVLTDLDGDGVVDRATVFEADGEYTVWVSSTDLAGGSDGSWRATDRGSL
ncbi:hypothetical protein HQ325_12165 [Rhodococcus sp. BP-349]|uniref:DUF6802 family protein n=1 Tax=unclassified Rhodococcus (in: high G+C Gram-positive bacteria) TaxID=192944 RepID=UPI001C9BB1C0|nr:MULTISPECIES: DUF6802 family protein [unclassified Rhodococcus (in: high G+C Gram-positive bacteria)]MBY6539429.1 hypothetical protein [Rhodococcus sp. BP-363]MBY6544243.1 hypothetical protein [Rhodococcus sp. BP-369]MBY6563473.1 hypothetical protein [Rhodococcus sp. BP-370]MBY6577765.1 hypothetical protein [Rhodococcus sp. BP-364]MBY6587066.1 hypothetical protein [Rhodococcus sp. BP-358]